MSVNHSTLPNGLRIVTEEVGDVDSVAMGVWASVGTRHEQIENNGVAHMVEHMLFKGTPSRSAQDIAEQIESVGGHMNAYTSREITSYHVHLLKDDFSLGLDILADMIQRSNLPDIEVERERQVILQEIGMTYDTPDDFVFDLYQQTAYPSQTLGAPVLGNPDIVAGMSREVLCEYISSNYHPGNLVVSVSGNLKHDHVEKLVQDAFSDLPAGRNGAVQPAVYNGGEARQHKELEQAHIVLGFRGVHRTSPDYQAAALLSTMLGGGMSSRLFQEIREKRGLVYSIFSLHSAYLDDGQMEIYAGTSPDSLPELVPVLCDEIAKMACSIREDELVRARAQRRSLLLMSRESMMSRADRNAKHMVFHGRPFNVQAELQQMSTITLQDVQALAERIFSSTPTLAALGPLAKLGHYQSICEKLAA